MEKVVALPKRSELPAEAPESWHRRNPSTIAIIVTYRYPVGKEGWGGALASYNRDAGWKLDKTTLIGS